MAGGTLVQWNAAEHEENLPFSGWREDCKYGQEEEGAAGTRLCPADEWAEPQFAAQPQKHGALSRLRMGAGIGGRYKGV